MSNAPSLISIDAAEAALSRLAGLESALSAEGGFSPVDDDFHVMYEQGRAALSEGQMDMALNKFATLAIHAPENPAHQYGYALCLQHFGRIEDAGRHYSCALALDPSDGSSAYRLAECLAATGHIDDARHALLMASKLAHLPDADPSLATLVDQFLEQLR